MAGVVGDGVVSWDDPIIKHDPDFQMDNPYVTSEVTLRDIDGWTGDEVCQALQLSDANQRVLLHRGRSRVRATLEGYLAQERIAART